MIFASDLDGTLIFSKKHCETISEYTEIVLVEKNGQEEISYMTKKSIEILKSMLKLSVFISVTTRTVEQYKRIFIFQDEIIPKFAITSNGGKILVNGEIDKEWEDYIDEGIEKLSMSAEDVFKRLSKFMNDSWVLSYRFADELFWVFIVNRDNMPENEMKNYINWANDNGWKVSIQGRKLYIIPEFINKWSALNHLNQNLADNLIISAGDSLLDYPMLINSTYGYVPLKCELTAYLDREKLVIPNLIFAKNMGIMAGEEILKNIRTYCLS